ncbi:MAG: hypothetical protein QGH60_22715 [Phycisphaerae bacterium]|jgi:hypothetical protein|nr:hypothetical protein [Phycisphaerae bacterium]
MSAKRINGDRFNGAWTLAIVLAAILLHAAAANAQVVVRDVIIDTVRSGTVLDSTATVSRDRRYVTVGMGLQNSGHTLRPAEGVAAAHFADWGMRIENGAAMLAMFVAIDRGRRIQKIIIPNKDPDAVTLGPEESVKKLAETLKIGDSVKFNYTIYGNRIFGSNISLLKRMPTKSGAAAFTFIRSRMVRVGKQNIMTVTANAGVTPCTFRVPEEIDANERSRPLAKVTDALKNFRRGDLLDLEYKTVNYQFVLTGVKAARKLGHGEIVKILSRRSKGYEHLGAKIKTDKRTLRLTDPEPVIKLKLRNVSNPTPDPPVQTALRTFKPGDYVMFRYRRQRGVYWLDGIYPTSRHESKPESESKSSTRAKGAK